jgi:glycosyltransferase involved in cell wall biosynthesis
MGTTTPSFVSAVLATHDRPEFLPIALACYGHQTHPDRELIVVDDGGTFPVSEEAVRAAGGRLIRLEPGTPLGTKMNAGLAAAQGPLCLKMDDDDWYAPDFLERMIAGRSAAMVDRCGPAVSFVGNALLFDLGRWELREAGESHLAGGTLLFARDDWQVLPFRAIPRAVDFWFVLDFTTAGARVLRLDAFGSYVQTRHQIGHLFAAQSDGRTVEESMLELPRYAAGPESLLPEWTLAIYRRRHDQQLAAGAVTGDAHQNGRQPICPLRAPR